MDGYLYQLHFSEPLGDLSRPRMSAQHYLGWAKSESSREARIEHHRRGTSGVAITKAAFDLGIEMHVVWLGEGTRDDERRMKLNGHHERRCMICRPTPCKDS